MIEGSGEFVPLTKNPHGYGETIKAIMKKPNLLGQKPSEQHARNKVAARLKKMRKDPIGGMMLKEERKKRKELEEQSLTDQLTGLNNRRFLYGDPQTGEVGMLEKLIRNAYRGKNPLSVVMLDIDHFKEINDQNGHPVGDLVLQGLSHIIKTNLRHSDFAIRYGGEEILLLLPATDLIGAVKEAEKVRKAVESVVFAEEVIPLEIKVSAGVSTYLPPVVNQPLAYEVPSVRLLKAADEALYKAKNEGRNQTWAVTDINEKELNFKPASDFTTGPLAKKPIPVIK